jgi:DNA-binding transcriptional LysR family regulator
METDLLAVLVAATECGSLSAAARRLGIPPMAATRRLAALEQELGARLLHRTTRALSLTPAGQELLPFARTVLETVAAGRAALRPDVAGASGLVRVTSSVPFGRKRIVPLLPALLDAHPELRIDLVLTDAVVDLVADGVDLAIRLAPLRENGLVARRLAPGPRLLCAAPAYLVRHGTPRRLADLAAHACLIQSTPEHWGFETAAGPRRVSVTGRVATNTTDALEAACLAGLGLRPLAQWNVEEAVRAGRLAAVTLEDATLQAFDIWAVYPSRHMVPPKVRVVIAALEAALRAA